MYLSPTQPVARMSGLAAGAAPEFADCLHDAVRAGFGGQGDDDFQPGPEPIDLFPAWLAGGIVVGMSCVFWIGLLTIVGWIV